MISLQNGELFGQAEIAAVAATLECTSLADDRPMYGGHDVLVFVTPYCLRQFSGVDIFSVFKGLFMVIKPSFKFSFAATVVKFGQLIWCY